MAESLVEAVLKRRLERGENLALEKGSDIETQARRCPQCGGPSRQDNLGPCEKCRPVIRCACGCGRPVDRRNRLRVSKFCFVRIVAAFRDAPEPLRRQLRKVMRRA